MHRAVLLDEVVEHLRLTPGKVILDCTVGGGGHARAILERITPNGRLIGVDQDEKSIKAAADRLTDFKDNIELVYDNFRNLETILSKLKIGKVDGCKSSQPVPAQMDWCDSRERPGRNESRPRGEWPRRRTPCPSVVCPHI